MSLMDDALAVEETCRIGKKIEDDGRRAEDEAFLRSWRSMPNGGHDKGFLRTLQEADVARRLVSEVLPGDKPGNGPDHKEKDQ